MDEGSGQDGPEEWAMKDTSAVFLACASIVISFVFLISWNVLEAKETISSTHRAVLAHNAGLEALLGFLALCGMLASAPGAIDECRTWLRQRIDIARARVSEESP